MEYRERLRTELAHDRALLREGTGSVFAPFVAHQRDTFGLDGHHLRLPEHFRGARQQAEVCFLGPHVLLLPTEPAPTVDSDLDTYDAYYCDRPEKRDPYGHYAAIMDGAPWLATELVHWPCEKEFALKLLKGPDGPAMVAAALDLTWAMLRDSQVKVLVLTGNDALKWVLPHLGYRGGALPGVTQLHGRNLGRFPLPGAPDREIRVIASFHWSKEMPMFVRKVDGLGGLPVGQAISESRRIIARAIAGSPVS